MWPQLLLCGLVIYKLVKRFFYDDDVLDVETSDSNAMFLVGSRIEKLYGGKVYLGLRIPDPDTGTRQNIDMVIVNKREAVVINVKNFSGFIQVDSDGSWICTGDHKHKTERHPDPWTKLKPEPKTRSTLTVLYRARDIRNEGTSSSDWKEISVRSSTEVLFQPQNSSKVRKFKLSSIISMSLSA
ncbi:hypothetical protein AQUCO_11700006v1 [Aquilegia coerulea]|uniref:NERD domain-containing protein n=1 Tax=Aquilegia coerulea TaxID=218851 RepID=A0A2G5C285_AQUCA|nr:hypothetical protein AQUCO_11700006v1 [Aquilegia coerulea]